MPPKDVFKLYGYECLPAPVRRIVDQIADMLHEVPLVPLPTENLLRICFDVLKNSKGLLNAAAERPEFVLRRLSVSCL